MSAAPTIAPALRLASLRLAGQDVGDPPAVIVSPAVADLRDRLAAARDLRREADGTLERLVADRTTSEARLRERGLVDHLEATTGRGALERAADTTQTMISHLDEVIDGLERELAARLEDQRVLSPR